MKKHNPVSVVRRSIWYILRIVVALTLVLIACYGIFMEAMQMSNIYIIVTEGMELRADCILNEGGSLEMIEYFTEEWVGADSALYDGKYAGFVVDSYDYRLDIETIRVLPWSRTASLVCVERIPSIQAEPDNEAENIAVPEWYNARYRVLLEKIEGNWLITELEVLAENPKDDEAKHTPDFSQLTTVNPE